MRKRFKHKFFLTPFCFRVFTVLMKMMLSHCQHSSLLCLYPFPVCEFSVTNSDEEQCVRFPDLEELEVNVLDVPNLDLPALRALTLNPVTNGQSHDSPFGFNLCSSYS